MGIIYSWLGYGRTDDPDPATGLTSRDKYLIRSTWNLVMKDAKRHGVELLCLFFREHPEYIKYFPFSDVPPEQFPELKKFQAHATNIMYALHAMVDNLDNTDLLVGLLVKNGETHGKRNIPEKSYWDLKEAALKTLEKGLGRHLTQEAKASWDKMLKVAITVIVKELNRIESENK